MAQPAHARLPVPEEIEAETPLRLALAAAIAFPDGSMTMKGLRREAARGRLAIERIAGKDYTTLAAIGRMRDLCRISFPLRPIDPVSSAASTKPDFDRAASALKQTLADLRSGQKPSGRETGRRDGRRDSQSPRSDV